MKCSRGNSFQSVRNVFFFLPTPTCGPTGMNDILSTVKSLHSTLYTVWVQVSYRAKLKDGVLFQRLHRQPRVKEHFQRGALIAWCFHPAHRKKTMWWEKKRIARQQSGERDVSGCPAYILAAVDELVYGHHPVFIFIHLLLERGKDNDEEGFSKASLLWLTATERRALPTAHLPERILLHADEASPLWGRGMCIFPSCRRWPSWCLAFPTTHRKEPVKKTFQWEAMQAHLLVCAWDVKLPSDISAAAI